jgi:hypothetical protein
MDMVTLLLQMLSGAVGGNTIASQLKTTDLGSLGNTLAGLIGGGLGSQILGGFLGLGATGLGGAETGGPDLANILGHFATAAFGGGLMTLAMSWVTRAVAR